MLIDEHIRPDGGLIRTHLEVTVSGSAPRIQVATDDGPLGELSFLAVERVLRRYGRELDPESDRVGGAELALTGGIRLRHLRFHAIVDAEARDYLVWDQPGEPPLAALATNIAAALRFLALRLSDERG